MHGPMRKLPSSSMYSSSLTFSRYKLVDYGTVLDEHPEGGDTYTLEAFLDRNAVSPDTENL